MRTITTSEASAMPTAIGTMSGVSAASQSLAVENEAFALLWKASTCTWDTTIFPGVPATVGVSSAAKLWARVQ